MGSVCFSKLAVSGVSRVLAGVVEVCWHGVPVFRAAPPPAHHQYPLRDPATQIAQCQIKNRRCHATQKPARNGRGPGVFRK